MGLSDPIQKDPLRGSENEHRDLAKGVLINVLGVVARTPKAIYFILFAQLFGAEIFGTYLLSLAVVEVVFCKIAGLGMDWGVLRLIVRLKARGEDGRIRPTVNRVLLLAFFSSLIMTAAVYFLSEIIGIYVLKKEELIRPLSLLGIAVPFITMSWIVLFAIRATRKMQYEVYVRSVTEPSVLLLGGIFVAVFYRRIEGLILVHVFSTFVGFCVALYYLCKVYPRAPERLPANLQWRSFLGYSLPMGAMDLLNNFKQKLDVMVVGRFLPLNLVGVVGVIIELINLLKKVRQAFEPIFMPITTYLHEMAEKQRLAHHFSRAVRWILLVALILLGSMMFAPDLFLRVYGNEFVIGSQAFMIFALGMFCYITLGLSETVLSMTGHPYITLINSIILVVINLSLHLALIPRFGLVGAAVATGISYFVIGVLLTFQTYRIVGVHPFARNQLKPVGAAAAALLLAFCVRWGLGSGPLPTLLGAVPVFLVTYLLLIRAFGLEEEDADILSKLRFRFRRLLGRHRTAPESVS